MRRIALAVGVPALALSLAACGSSSDSPSSPASFQLTQDDTLSAAVSSAGDATSEDVALMSTSELSLGMFSVAGDGGSGVYLSLGRTNAPSAGWGTSSGCAFSTATNIYTCAAENQSSLTLVRTFEFFDANGNPMPKYNDTTTASLTVTLTENGIRTSNDGADTISRHRNFTATGLLGHETSRTWNGTAARTDGGYHTDTAVTRTYHNTDNSVFTNIVVDLPRTANPWPVSGTITRTITGAGSVTKKGVTKTFTFTKTVTITFNGTQHATMVVGNVTYTVDLGAGTATKG